MMWTRLVHSGSAEPKNENQVNAVNRYNDVMMVKKLGLDPERIPQLPQDWYDDAIAILNIKEKHEYNEQQKSSRSASHGRR